MKKVVVVAGCVSLVFAFFMVVSWYLNLPVVQLGLNGNCVRVILADGKHAPCSFVDGKRYVTEHVW